MYLTVIAVIEVTGVWALGWFVGYPLVVWALFLGYLLFFHLKHSPAFRNSRLLEFALPAVEVRGPGKDLIRGDADAEWLGPGKPAIFGVHPHGVYAVSTIAAFAPGAHNHHRRFVGHSFLFWLPIIREFCQLGGGVPATRRSMTRALREGHQLVMCPRGLREMTQECPVKERRGFIEIAKLVDKTVLVPVWAPDEHALYSVWLPFGAYFQDVVRIMYPWPVVNFGRAMWPRNIGRPLRVYVGTPIELAGRSSEEAQVAFYDALKGLEKQAAEDSA